MTNTEKIIIGELCMCLGIGMLCLCAATTLLSRKVEELETEVFVAERPEHKEPQEKEKIFDPDRRIIGFTPHIIK